MDLRLGAVVCLLVAVALAGCVGSDDGSTVAPDPAAEGGPSAMASGPGPATQALPEPVATPLSLDGISPAGIWICAAAQATGNCELVRLTQGDDTHDVPFVGTVTALEISVTFEKVTPEIQGLFVAVYAVLDTEWEQLGYAEGDSGTTLSLSDLNMTAPAMLRVVSYTMPDANAGGPVWLDLIEQPYRLVGTLTERRP